MDYQIMEYLENLEGLIISLSGRINLFHVIEKKMYSHYLKWTMYLLKNEMFDDYS